MDDNLFDEDDALDYVLYEDCEKGSKYPNRNSGCAGMLILMLAPSAVVVLVRFI